MRGLWIMHLFVSGGRSAPSGVLRRAERESAVERPGRIFPLNMAVARSDREREKEKGVFCREVLRVERLQLLTRHAVRLRLPVQSGRRVR